jgi:hypothetical protein
MPDYAFCGADCESCAAFQASQSKDPSLKQWLAADCSFEDLSFTPDQLTCLGCKIQTPTSHICAQCQIRACALGTVRGTCAECGDYPCSLINRFVAVETDARNVLDYLHESLTV